jgi:hypothetical protein
MLHIVHCIHYSILNHSVQKYTQELLNFTPPTASKVIIPWSVLLITMVTPYFQVHGNESQNEMCCLEMDRTTHRQLLTDPTHRGAYPSGQIKDRSLNNVSEPMNVCLLYCS